ncbi:hypothetical protein ABZV58_13225 [Nocardia sp. NPDC004654]|uniref:hypothetical protein n=1 Tax=Nocardia sp. NPDC004654 TaxID=3154776 RepID=UPI0033B2647F
MTEKVIAAAATGAGAGSAGAAKSVSASAAPLHGADSVGRDVSAKGADSVESATSVSAESADSVELPKGGDSAGSTSIDLDKPESAKSATAEGTSDDSGDTETPGSLRDQLGLGRILAMAASAVLVLALVAGAVVSTIVTRSADMREQRRTEYVQTARQAILNLTTIRADSAKEDIDRILSLASGQFKTEFDGRVDPFLSIVQQAKVVSNGEIVEAALESDADDSAKVLVAAKQTLTNAGQAEPQTRFYRFRVTVTRGDSGLSASNVEFVP